nr:hypothetical protein [uncultured Undibacterium sp.]
MRVQSLNNRRLKGMVLLWAILLVLLSAQWLGYAHRMSHISTVTGDVLSLASDGSHYVGIHKLPTTAETSLHSCLLVDAASITDCLQHSLSLNAPTVLAGESAYRSHQIIWLASLRLPFLSRAPPALKLV